MCFHRTTLYKACGHTEFRRFMCNPVPITRNDDQSDLDSSDQVYMKGRFACGEPPEEVNDLELSLCGHCRKTRYRNKEAARRRAVLGQEQSLRRAGVQALSSDRYGEEPQYGEQTPEQQNSRVFLPEPAANDPKRSEKSEDVDTLPADDMEEWGVLKQNIEEAIKGCRKICEEVREDQPKAISLLDAIGSQSEYRPMSDKSEPPAISNERSTKPKPATTEATLPQPRSNNPRTLSHSATKVRRDLNAARGRVRSMIQAINTKSDASHMIRPINHRSMVTTMVNTISRNREPSHSAKPEAPVAPKKELTKRPLPSPPSADPRTLPKPAKLQVLAKHRYHRLVPIPEESTSQALIVANSLPNTVVLRRAKAVKVRNLNAFHCPVRQPRFGLKRKVLAPPVPRHSTPPVAVPCSKFADLGRRRVSELEWCFVI